MVYTLLGTELTEPVDQRQGYGSKRKLGLSKIEIRCRYRQHYLLHPHNTE